MGEEKKMVTSINGAGSTAPIETKDHRKASKKTPRGPLSTPTPRDVVKARWELEKAKLELEKAKLKLESSSSDDSSTETTLDNMMGMLDKMDETWQRFEDEKTAARQRFAAMDEDEQEVFIEKMYDRFSASYDEHMETTGHYEAIRRLITKEVAAHNFQFPFFDITSGTGVPACHFLLELNKKLMRERKTEVNFIVSKEERREYHVHPIYLNDISEKMNVLSEKKFNELEHILRSEVRSKAKKENKFDVPPILIDDKGVAIKDYSFRSLYTGLGGKVGTIMVSQTFHIVTSADKERLAKAIDWALAPGGRVVLIEEFVWRARTHSGQAPSAVLKLIETLATPLQKKSDLISLFKDKAGRPYEMISRSTERIDREHRDHEMTVTILQKPSDNENEQINFFF